MILRTLPMALVAVLILFSGCSKNDDSPPVNTDSFIINGLHDVSFNSAPGSNILAVSVAQQNGSQERVTLSVENLPQSFSALIEPASGVPSFNAFITIVQNGVGPAGGKYPFKVTARSSTFTKSYDLNLIVPANGYVIKTDRDTIDLSDPRPLQMNVETTGSVAAEPATISFVNLPAQLEAQIRTATGTPAFSSEIGFTEKSLLAEGFYPVTIQAKSASYSGSRQLVIRARALNGYTLDGAPTRARVVVEDRRIIKLINTGRPESAYLGDVEIQINGTTLPSMDGVSNEEIGSTFGKAQITYNVHDGSTVLQSYKSSAPTPGQTLKITVSGGKFRVEASGVVLIDPNTREQKTISFDASQL